jgi:hypothetical protein
MSHDKIRAAARQRMAATGEPYAAARRAAVGEHQAATGGDPPAGRQRPAGKEPAAGTGCALAMSSEIRDWLADLRIRDPAGAAQVGHALATLMEQGASLADPMVVSTAEAWPWALTEALDVAYRERLERLTVLRRGEAEAVTLARDLQVLRAELDSIRAKLAETRRAAVTEGSQLAAQDAARQLVAVDQQAAEVRQLLPAMIQAGQRLSEQNRRRQARVEAFRVRKEVRTASFVAASGSLRVREAMAAASLAGDDAGQPPADDAAAIGAAKARLADLTAELEREAGQQAWPAGLMALRPGTPADGGFCLLFAAEPAGTALLLAVLDGAEAVAERYFEAVLAAADLLRQVRAGQAPEAAVHAFLDPGPFLAEFYPRGAAADSSGG